MYRRKRLITKRRVFTVAIVLVIFVMSLGYAALSQYVELEGIASIDRSWIVKVTKVTNTVTNSATSISSNYVSNTVTLNANLPTSSSTITYTITLSNQGNIPAKLNNIEIVEDENSNITYEISGVEEEVTTLAPGETNTAKVTIKYKSGVTNISETKKELMLTFIYVENSGTTGGNSGDSTSDTENVVYQLGDTISTENIVRNDNRSFGNLFYAISSNDTKDNTTINVITDLVSHTEMSVENIVNSDTISVAFKPLSAGGSVPVTYIDVTNPRLPTMEEIGYIANFKYDSSKNYDGETFEMTQVMFNTNTSTNDKFLTSTTKDGKYYTYTINGTQLTIHLVDASEIVWIRAIITLNKEDLDKYQRYQIGDSVELIDGSKWYVTKDSGTGNAMVTLISENGASSNGSVLTYGTYSRGFDTSGSNIYNQFSSTNIGYYVKNTVESYIKNAIKSNGGNDATTIARLLTKGEYDRITKNDTTIPSWLKIPGAFWMMTNTGNSVYYFNGSSLSTTTTLTSNYKVRPVITTLKSNLKDPIYLVDQILKDNTERDGNRLNFESTSEESKTNGLYYTNRRTINNKITYFFRGAVENNYVYFAGLYWRIIRINEDSSIRLIYQGINYNTMGTDATIGTGTFNSETIGDNAYVGYMYGAAGSNTYTLTHANTNGSVIKEKLDTWYQNNLLSYSRYIADSGFCGDRSIAEEPGTWVSYDTALGYAKNETYYGPYNRVENDARHPLFECPQKNDWFTLKGNTQGNEALNYPIGLLSLDEIVYAGGSYSIENTSYYLYTEDYYWTMSPYEFNGNGSYVGVVSYNGAITRISVDSPTRGIRPVINLKSDVAIISGNGTSSNPYVVKTN